MAVTPISSVTPKYFLGAQITNPKILASKVEEVLDVVNTIQTGTLALDALKLDSGSQVGSDTPTINKASGTITTAVTATAALGTKTVSLTNSLITTSSKVFAVIDGYGGTGLPLLYQVKTFAGSADILIYNAHATVALSAAFDIHFLVIN